MRLAILDRGHGLGAKALFAFIRAVSRQPTPDPLKLVMYRPDFYGGPMKAIMHEAMRHPRLIDQRNVWRIEPDRASGRCRLAERRKDPECDQRK